MRTHRILVLAVLISLAACLHGYAKDKDKGESSRLLTGRVTDKQEAPIAGAVVYLSNTRTRAVKTFIAGEGARATFEILRSVVFAAGAFPGHQLANRRSADAGGWVFVCLHFGTRRFLSHRANAEADLLLILVHLDDLEVMLLARFEVNRMAVCVHGFGVVAEAFDSVGKLYECAEAGNAQHFAMQNVADVVLLEERLPDIRLKLLDTE